MPDLAQLRNFHLCDGSTIATIEITSGPLTDALGRDAVAITRIRGAQFHILLRPGLSSIELSITLYHEILEAAAVASVHPPRQLANFNEGDFERAARALHRDFGDASPANLNRMLRFFGFMEQ